MRRTSEKPLKTSFGESVTPNGHRWLQADLRATVAQDGTERESEDLCVFGLTWSCVFPNEPGVTESGYERAVGSEGARAELEAPAQACHQATDQVGRGRVRDGRSVQGADAHG